MEKNDWFPPEAFSFLSNEASCIPAKTLVISGLGHAGARAVSERQLVQGISTVCDVTE